MRHLTQAGSKERAVGARRNAVAKQRGSRLASLAILLTLGLALLLGGSGCGGGGSSGPATPQSPPPGPPAACVTGTVAGYMGTSCSQGATVYNWTSYSCTSTPSSICDGLGVNGANLAIAMDPRGQYTILVGQTNLWNVTAGQSVDVMIQGTVYGATKNGNWPHFKGLAGQTGDGTEENITTVGCSVSGNCTNNLNGVSDDLCDAAKPGNCVDLSVIPSQFLATFNAATSTNPYSLTIEIKLNGGTSGSATLYSVGTHLIP